MNILSTIWKTEHFTSKKTLRLQWETEAGKMFLYEKAQRIVCASNSDACLLFSMDIRKGIAATERRFFWYAEYKSSSNSQIHTTFSHNKNWWFFLISKVFRDKNDKTFYTQAEAIFQMNSPKASKISKIFYWIWQILVDVSILQTCVL